MSYQSIMRGHMYSTRRIRIIHVITWIMAGTLGGMIAQAVMDERVVDAILCGLLVIGLLVISGACDAAMRRHNMVVQTFVAFDEHMLGVQSRLKRVDELMEKRWREEAIEREGGGQ